MLRPFFAVIALVLALPLQVLAAEPEPCDAPGEACTRASGATGLCFANSEDAGECVLVVCGDEALVETDGPVACAVGNGLGQCVSDDTGGLSCVMSSCEAEESEGADCANCDSEGDCELGICRRSGGAGLINCADPDTEPNSNGCCAQSVAVARGGGHQALFPLLAAVAVLSGRRRRSRPER